MIGKTKIQLCNAVTGAVEQEVEKHNMITNAVKNYLSAPLDYTLSGNGGSVNIYKASENILPLCDNGMAGILLWSDTLPEDANQCITSWDNTMIGNAGEVYSGTNTYRGTLNANETCSLPNGKRFVWDFGTDRANGQIAAISLTSLQGGNAGVATATDGVYVIDKNMTAYYSATNYGMPLGEISRGVWVCGAISVTNKTYTLKYVRTNTVNNISFTDKNNNYSLINTITLSLPSMLSTISGNYAYIGTDNYAHIVSYSSAFTYNHYIIDFINGSIISNTTVTLTGLSNYTSDNHVVFGTEYIYAVFYNKTTKLYDLLAFTLDGVYVTALSTNRSSNTYFYGSGPIGDGLRVQYNIVIKGLNLRYCKLISSASTNNRSVYSYRSKSPVIYSVDNNGYWYVNYGLWMPYLATINNLTTPITKTAAQTMKITYEITES